MPEAPLDWSEIYARLARRPERPDSLAMDALERRVRAWTRDDEVAAETCAEVLRTFNLARGGAAFEGFVQGRFIEAVGAAQQGIPHPRPLRCAARTSAAPTSLARERGDAVVADEADPATQAERLARCLEELRARNPRHHSAALLLYEDRATVPEAADALAVDVWTVRTLVARARQALAQCLERAGRRRAPRDDAKPRPPRIKAGRPGGQPSHRQGRRSPRG